MKRKVLRVGNSSLAVSLPSKWVKENNLVPGAEIEFSDDGRIIASGIPIHAEKSHSLDISGFTYFQLIRYLTVLYRLGYDRVKISFTDPAIYHDKRRVSYPIPEAVKHLSRRFVGCEVISQTDSSLEIEFFLSNGMSDLEKVERRIYFLFKETIVELLNSKADHASFHKTIYDRHDTITKFINFYLRVLATSDLSVNQKTIRYATYLQLDGLMDNLRQISERIASLGANTKVYKHLEKTLLFFTEAYFIQHSGKFDASLAKARFRILHEIETERFTPTEMLVVNEALPFLNILNTRVESMLMDKIEGE